MTVKQAFAALISTSLYTASNLHAVLSLVSLNLTLFRTGSAVIQHQGGGSDTVTDSCHPHCMRDCLR